MSGLELSPELQRRANAVIENPRYQGPSLAQKAMISIVGPFGVGKSTITDQFTATLTEMKISAGPVGSRMTRERRPNDPDYYVTGVDPEELIARGERGELINLVQNTTGHLYATDFESVPHDVNIGPILPDALDTLQRAGFGVIKSFYLTTTPEQWQKQLNLDGRLGQPDAAKRIEEAQDSLEYVMDKLTNPRGLPLTIIHNDGTRSVEDLTGHLLFATGYQEFHSSVKRFANYKPLVQEMYNYATLLEPEDKAA